MGFGDVGHVLTNTVTGSSDQDWTCYSSFIYSRDGSAGHAIEYDGTNWVDHSSADWPTHFGLSSTDGSTVAPVGTDTDLYLWNGSTFVCKLVNPDPESSGGGSGGGSGGVTLSVVSTEFTTSVPNGVSSVYDSNGPELYYTIAKTEPSGSYHIYLDDVYSSTITHTNGAVSAGQTAGRYYGTNNKLYFGPVMTSSSLNTLVAEFTWSSQRKVFCNFW
jgi:hypothetical protein